MHPWAKPHNSPGYQSARCPECDGVISFRHLPRLGQLLNCGHCGEILTVVGSAPLTLDWAFEEPDGNPPVRLRD